MDTIIYYNIIKNKKNKALKIKFSCEGWLKALFLML